MAMYDITADLGTVVRADDHARVKTAAKAEAITVSEWLCQVVIRALVERDGQGRS